jgi:outer membrane protein assembly factor BamB
MVKSALAQALSAALIAGSAAGCGVSSKLGAFLASNKSGNPAPEHVFEVDWWSRADKTFGVPFQPVELGSPDFDARSGSVFVATEDGRVHAFDDAGQPLWSFEVGGSFDAGPTYADGRVYVSSAKGKLLALDAVSGRLLWSYSTGDELVTRPTVGGGLVFAAGASDTLFAVDQEPGAWKWQYRREAPGEFTIRGAARPLFVSGRLFAGFADGYAVCLQASDGTVTWTKDLGQGKPYADVDAGPLADEAGRVYFGAFATGLFALEGGSGAIAWTVALPGITALSVDPGGERIHAGGAGFLEALDRTDGALRWKLALGADRSVTGLSTANNLLLASTGSGPLLFVEASSGVLRRTFDPGRGVSAAPTTRPGRALVLSNRGYVYALDVTAWGRR